MNKSHFAVRIIVLFAFTLAISVVAQAQATRTWVSGVGDDVNPCSRTAPCKTFAGAISKTFIGGEIDALDPGGFGTVTITKSITIDGGSAFGSILASGTNGVNVNLTSANDPEKRVTLRRLSINGTGSSGAVGQRTGIRGINFTSGLALYVENCYIAAFTQEGIRANLTAAGGYLSVKDTNIQNCNVGIDVTTSTGIIELLLERTRIERMTSNGVNVGNNVFGTISNSQIFFNNTDGINMLASATSARVAVEGSVVSNNPGVAIRSGGAGSDIIVSNTSISSNATAFATGGGQLHSHGNNSVDGTIGVTPTPVGQQ
jgi:hypothetical protein